MQLQEKYPEDLLAITLSVDFEGDDGNPPQELQSDVNALLKRLNIKCTNIICSDNIDSTLESLDIVSIPAVLIFDKNGQLHKKIDGSVSYESDVLPVVEELLE